MKLLEILRPGGPLTPGKAYTCAMINQLAMPGAGSMIGGRFLTGILQLAASGTGFILAVVWFIKLMGYYYALSNFEDTTATTPVSHHWIGLTGAGLFVFSWCWALITSFLILKQARQMEGERPTLPPQLPLK